MLEMKVIKIILGVFIGIILLWIIWINLPVKYNRVTEIKLGNQIIEKIESSKEELPENNDWEKLNEYGIYQEYEIGKPEYKKINDNEFEIIFVEGFDPPYLIWNSSERKWKKGSPTL